MSFEEKVTWVSAVVFAVVPVVYVVDVLGQLGQMPASEIAYQQPMLIAIGVSIVLTILGSIAHGNRQRHHRRDHGSRVSAPTSAGPTSGTPRSTGAASSWATTSRPSASWERWR